MSEINELLNIFYPNGLEKPFNKYILRNNDIKNKLIILTDFLDDDVSFSERLYCLKNNINIRQICSNINCENEVKFANPSTGYRDTCSLKCSNSSTQKKDKIKNTLIDRYGGVGFAADQIKKKVSKTNLEKFGTVNAMQNKEIQSKLKETMLERYGCENISLNPETIEKKKKTFMEKYGVTSNSQFHITKSAIDIINNKDKLILILSESDSAFEVSQLLGVTPKTILDKIKEFDILYTPRSAPISYAEKELFTFINSKTKIQSDRSVLIGKELDIYIPDKNIAIEYNGIYWHSESNGKDKKYHLTKTLECDKKGIQLIQIFENEWLEKKEIVKSIINSKMGLFHTRIFARKTTVKELDTSSKNDFLEENHLQGKDLASVKLGLFHDDELVSVMTFGHSRFNKNYQYEMHRFANKQGVQIIGGASKLWKYFINNYNPESVITYADRRYSNGMFYEKIGFKLKNVSSPNFWVMGKGIKGLESRIGWQKHKLKDKLDIFNPELSAWENMQINGYNRIWDCGNYVFEWKKTYV